MTDTIAASFDDYEALAIRLAGDPAMLQGLKARLAARLPDCALFDSDRFTRNIERAYERMFERHIQGLPPDHIVV